MHVSKTQQQEENRRFQEEHSLDSTFHYVVLSLLGVMFSNQSQEDKLDQFITHVQPLFPNTDIVLFSYNSEQRLKILRSSFPITDAMKLGTYPTLADTEFSYFPDLANDTGKFSDYHNDFPAWKSGVTFSVSSLTRRYSLFLARTTLNAFDLSELEKIQEGMLLVEMALKLLSSMRESSSDLQRNEQDAKRVSLGKLAAGVAHEINNPLGFVMSNFNTLSSYLAQVKAHPEIQQINDCQLAEILDDSESIIVESLEGLSRIKNIVASLNVYYHESKLSVGMVDLRDVVSSATNMVLGEMKLKARLNYEPPQIPFYVLGQTHKLQQVLINLLVNALQSFSHTDGEVNVALYMENSLLIENKSSVCLSVCDNGKGICPEDLVYVFDPFFTTKRIGDGAGLGLSVAKEIIEEHLGKIEIQSTIGQGTCVYIRLPLYVAPHHSMKGLG
ncbi:sensor histidine kinase [Vibrio anguillarum]|uniref:sensor histidine kinase n=1 Tax=Vibrio anguillarum TaxID=55601 RepID=UPI000BB47507|nr:ATP-binding protein [Vibrio anguillarum]ATC59723.1 two-component sensor histidine kinase [Vibrio anguillarum]